MNTRPINALLFVDGFNPTGNPGEYTFENGHFTNQADQTGNGAFDVEVGFVLYVPSTNANTAVQIPGVLHRYKLTAVEVVDGATLNGTMIWDELGAEETEVPTNGVGCGLSQVSPNSHYGYAPSDGIYPDLPAGLTAQTVQTDLWNITDVSGGGPGPDPSGVYKETIGDASTQSFVVHHALGTLDVAVTVYELSTGEDVYAGITRTGLDDVRIDFTYPIDAASHRVLIRAI